MGDSKPDVQMLCHQIVAKVSEYDSGGVLASIDALIEPLEKTCNKQVPARAGAALFESPAWLPPLPTTPSSTWVSLFHLPAPAVPPNPSNCAF